MMKQRARTCLLAAEDRALLACTDIVLSDRVLYGTIVREGFRPGEALRLEIRDIDLQKGMILVDRYAPNARTRKLGSGVAKALRHWVLHFHPTPLPTAPLFPIDSRDPLVPPRTERLRHHLRSAGCQRRGLYVSDKEHAPISLLDLRATFVALSIVNGRAEAWVALRTGLSSRLIHAYRQRVANLDPSLLRPLDSLVEAIPELREGCPARDPHPREGLPLHPSRRAEPR